MDPTSRESSREISGSSYDFVANIYEVASRIYSLGQITASKRAQLRHIEPGAKVLFLGVGSGEDAVLAARQGAQVTCIDISSGMLKKLRKRLDREQLTAELICQDMRKHDRLAYYDAVTANYFLNVFVKPDMQIIFRHAVSLLKPNGIMMIADVALAQGGLLARVFNVLYLKFSMVSCWLLSLVPLHRTYDYREEFPSLSLQQETIDHFRLWPRGPVVFQNIVATKKSNEVALEENKTIGKQPLSREN